MLATILLLGLMLVAAATDRARHKIYNWTTYPGILAALVPATAASLLAAGGASVPTWPERLGWPLLGPALVGFVLCGFMMLVCFVMFRVGGGDVKLIAMMGAFLGPEKGLEAMLWTFVIGGCMGLVVLVWRLGPLELIRRIVRHLGWAISLGRLAGLTEEERAVMRSDMFLAPSALAAVVIVRFSLVT